jgi:hypothetical protein
MRPKVDKFQDEDTRKKLPRTRPLAGRVANAPRKKQSPRQSTRLEPRRKFVASTQPSGRAAGGRGTSAALPAVVSAIDCDSARSDVTSAVSRIPLYKCPNSLSVSVRATQGQATNSTDCPRGAKIVWSLEE